MKKKLRGLLFFLVLILPVDILCSENVSSVPFKEGSGMCLQEVRIARNRDPFRQFEARSAKDPSIVRTVHLDRQAFDAVPSLSRYTAGDVMLMGVEKKTGEPMLSERYFSPLARVDATRIDTGQAKEIGRVLNGSGALLTPRNIALFLLESQIVRTYWHVESIICLTSEDERGDIYRASFQGIHRYFTNTYNEEKLSFSIAIDRVSGAMTLVGN